MTSPNDSVDSHYWFGRIDGKIDQLGDKMGHLTETVGRHDERISNVEDRQDKADELRVADQERAEQARLSAEQLVKGNKGGVRAAVIGAVSGAFTGGIFTLIQALVSHK